MSRLRPLEPSEMTPEARAIVEGYSVRFGFVPELVRSTAHSPPMAQAIWDLVSTVLIHGRLPRVLKELIILFVAHRQKSPYVLQIRAVQLSKLGLRLDSMMKIAENPEGADLPIRDRELLLFADRLAFDPHSLGAPDFQRLREHGLTDAEIGEVVAIASLALTACKLADGLGVTSDSGLEKLLPPD